MDIGQSWIFIDAEAEAPILWPPDSKSQLIGKDSGTGKDWGQEEKGQQGMRLLDEITYSMNMSLSKLWEMVKDREAWCAAVHRIQRVSTVQWLNNNNSIYLIGILWIKLVDAFKVLKAEPATGIYVLLFWSLSSPCLSLPPCLCSSCFLLDKKSSSIALLPLIKIPPIPQKLC